MKNKKIKDLTVADVKQALPPGINNIHILGLVIVMFVLLLGFFNALLDRILTPFSTSTDWLTINKIGFILIAGFVIWEYYKAYTKIQK